MSPMNVEKHRKIVKKYRQIAGWALVVLTVAVIDRAYNQIWDIAERVYPDMLTRFENVSWALLFLFALALVTGWVIYKILPSGLSA